MLIMRHLFFVPLFYAYLLLILQVRLTTMRVTLLNCLDASGCGESGLGL